MSEKGIFDISGKAALVTGASRGLGRAFAEVLAEFGADVCCVGRDEAKLAETMELVAAYKHRAFAIVADMSSPDEVQRMTEETVRRLGKIDILVNNAGIAGVPNRIHEMPIEDWDEVIATNLRTQFLCMKAVLPFMLKNKGGSHSEHCIYCGNSCRGRCYSRILRCVQGGDYQPYPVCRDAVRGRQYPRERHSPGNAPE